MLDNRRWLARTAAAAAAAAQFSCRSQTRQNKHRVERRLIDEGSLSRSLQGSACPPLLQLVEGACRGAVLRPLEPRKPTPRSPIWNGGRRAGRNDRAKRRARRAQRADRSRSRGGSLPRCILPCKRYPGRKNAERERSRPDRNRERARALGGVSGRTSDRAGSCGGTNRGPRIGIEYGRSFGTCLSAVFAPPCTRELFHTNATYCRMCAAQVSC